MKSTKPMFGPGWLWSVSGLVFLCLSGCASSPRQDLVRPVSVWSTEFQYPVSYHKLIGDDLLIVGTGRHLWGVDPATGDRLWRLRNVNTNRRDVIQVQDASFILINDAAGGAFDDAGTHVLAVDRGDGSLLWESPVYKGRILQARLDYRNNRLFAVVVEYSHGDDRGLFSDLLPDKGLFSGLKREPQLAAVDLSDGTVIWHQGLGDDVLMRPSYRPGVSEEGQEGTRPFDLGIYHPPMLLAGQVCVTYDGIRCFNAADGRLTWFDRFKVIDDKLGKSYPNPVVNDGLLVAGDTDRLYGYDPLTGERIWRTRSLDRVPELLDDESILYAQVGGRYFDIDDEEWVAKGPFAALAVNKRNGNVLWRYDRVRRSITNLMVTRDFVWLGDDEALIALDRLDGTVGFRQPHKLGEPPLFILLNELNQIVLISESEVAGYDPDSARLLWYHHYPAPGPGAWRRFAAGLLKVSGGIFKLSSTVIAYGGGMLPAIPNITTSGGQKLLSGKRSLQKVGAYLGEKLSQAGEAITEESGFANLTGTTQYFVTRPKGTDQVVLAAVDVNSGATRRLTVLPSQSPNLVIDEINGLIYQARENALEAVPLGD